MRRQTLPTMSPPNLPPKFKPSSSGVLDFHSVSLDSARAALDELPSGVERVLDGVPGYWVKNRRTPLATDRALTGRAMDWTVQLPANIRPVLTTERYPRIVNAIAAAWPDSEARARACSTTCSTTAEPAGAVFRSTSSARSRLCACTPAACLDAGPRRQRPDRGVHAAPRPHALAGQRAARRYRVAG